MFWYTVGQINKKCYGMSAGAVRWLAYEIVVKNNIKDNALKQCILLDFSTILTINFTNYYL